MNSLSKIEIDASIDRVVSLLSPEVGISNLYPCQRNILHEFTKGYDIFYTGKRVVSCNLYIEWAQH